MKPFFKQLHRYIGLFLGLMLSILFLTGMVNAIDELCAQMEFSDQTYVETNLEDMGKNIESIISKNQNIRQIRLPIQTSPFYQVQVPKQSITYSMVGLTELQSQRDSERFFSFALSLHKNYLLGKEGLLEIPGKEWVAWTGLLGIVSSLIGLWLWWPLRKSFKIQSILPIHFKRKHFFLAHIHSGIVVLLPFIFLSLTGTVITYRSLTKDLLGIEAKEKENLPSPIKSDRDWGSWLRVAQQSFPNSAIERIRFQKGKSEKVGSSVEIYFQGPNDWLGLALSKVTIDSKSSAIIGVENFYNLPFAEKCIAIVLPLHTGKGLHGFYLWMLIGTSLLGFSMVLTGMISYILKIQK